MRIWSSIHPIHDSDHRRDRRRSSRARARRRASLGRRGLALERVEDRLLLTSGPQLISIIPDAGGLLLPGQTLNVAPSELTFRFNQGEVINPATLSGIELVRSGGTGTFNNANDVPILPGFVGVDATQKNEVVMRFSAPLPDDLYQIMIVGAGANTLMDTGNVSSGGSTPAAAFNGGVNYTQDFRLNLAPQVLAVVPEPFTTLTTGVKEPLNNQIDVYFNQPLDPASANDPAFYQLIRTQNTATTADDGAPILPQSVTYTDTPNPDGTVTHEAVLIFNGPSGAADPNAIPDWLAQDAAKNANLTNPTTGVVNEAFRLRIGNTNQPLPSPAVDTVASPAAHTLSSSGDTSPGSAVVSTTNTSGMSVGDMVKVVGAGSNGADLYSTIASVDSTTQFTLKANAGATTTAASIIDYGQAPGNTFNTAQNTGTLSGQTQILTSAIAPLADNPNLLFPGGAIGAGIRNIPIESHLQGGTSTAPGGVTTIYYNFQKNYGTDPSGNVLSNQILSSPQQMQDVRDIMGLFAYYSGAKFVETTSATNSPAGALNITVVTGDIRAVQASIPATSQNGIEGSTSLVSTAAIINGNVNWGASEYGGAFFVMAMREIASALGLGSAFELPAGNVTGVTGSENPNQTAQTAPPPAPVQPPEPMFPGYGDISALDYLYRTDSKAIDLYKFQVLTPGNFSAETFAQRLTPTSSLNTVLTLYNQLNALGVPANGGQAVAAAQAALGAPLTFTVNDPTHPVGAGVTFEFNDGYSLQLPAGATGSSLNGESFTLNDGTQTITFQFTDSATPPPNINGGSIVYIAVNPGDTFDTAANAQANPPQLGLTGKLAAAINFAVKNDNLGSGISASYLADGAGVVNIGGGIGFTTTFAPDTTGITLAGSPAATTPGAFLVRYAPADSQHQLAIDLAHALNDTGYSLALPSEATGASVNGQTFTLGDGTQTITFQFTTTPTPNSAKTVYIVVNRTDTAGTLTADMVAAINIAVTDDHLGGGISANLAGYADVVQIGGGAATTFSAGTSGIALAGYNTGALNLTATAELNQVRIAGPITVDVSGTTSGGAPLLPATIVRTIISRNDNYYGTDSAINLPLTPGYYYVAVSASGNTNFDPNVADSGWGGTSNGAYELHLNFRPNAVDSLVSLVSPVGTGLNVLGGDSPQPLNGDPNGAGSSSGGGTGGGGTGGSGTGGSAYNFWFNVTDVNHTFYVDKAPPTTTSGPLGSYTNPFTTISAALASGDLQPGTNLRIEGDLPANFTSLAPGQQQQDLLNAPSYDIGTENFAHQNAILPDGATFNVPRGVTVMIDAGAIFKMRQSWIDVGTSAVNIDRSQGALQVLGIPGEQVIFTSLNDTTVAAGSNSLAGDPTRRGDWGGILFRQDSDLAPLGIFLNYVNEARLQWGGGQVLINGQPTVVDPVDLISSRPTITNNTILDSSDAAISGNPNSFADTTFQRDITITAQAGAQIADGQTFQIHGQTFEFDSNPSSSGTPTVLAGNVPIFFHSSDTPNQIAVDMAEAINGAQLAHPAVQAAVTGAQLTLTNTQIDSPVALNTVLGGFITNGWAFAVNGVVFEFNNGGKLLNPNAVPISFSSGDSEKQVAQEIAAAINLRSIDNGNGQLVYAQAVATPNSQGLPQARVDLMNTSDVNLSLPNTNLPNPGFSLSLITPMSIDVSGDVNPATGANGQPVLLSVADGQSFTVNGHVFEFDSGYTLVVPANGALGITDGTQFGLSDGLNTITFVFYKESGHTALTGQVLIPLNTNDSADQVAADMVNAINNSGLANLFARSLGNGLGQVNIGGNAATTFLPDSGTIMLKLGQAGDVERPGAQIPGAIAVPFYPTMSTAQLAAAIGTAVSAAGIGVSANVVVNSSNVQQPQVVFQNVNSLLPNPSALDVSGELQAAGPQAGMLYALDGQSFTLNGSVFEFNSGYTLQAPANGGAGIAAALAAGITPTFSLSDGVHTVNFIFYTSSGTPPAPQPNNQVGILFSSTDTADMVAGEIATAINHGVFTALGFSLAGITATPLGHGTGQVNVGSGHFGTGAGRANLPNSLSTVFSPGSGQITATGQPGAQIPGAFAVPFVPFDATDPTPLTTLANDIATAINDAAIGVVAQVSTTNPSLVLFQHAYSLVTSATLGTRSPLAVQTDPVFVYGADALPLSLSNNFYTADYARVGPDVHGNTLAVNLTPVLNTVAAGVGGIVDGQQFIVNNQGFEFTSNSPTSPTLAPGFVAVNFNTTDSAAQIAQDIVTAVNDPTLGLGVNAVAPTGGSQVFLYGAKYANRLDINPTATGGTINGETITVSVAGKSTTFEFNSDNHSTTNTSIVVNSTDSAGTLAADAVAAIDTAVSGADATVVFGGIQFASGAVISVSPATDPPAVMTTEAVSNLRPFGAFNVNTLNSALVLNSQSDNGQPNVEENALNGLLVRINTLAGQSLDTLDVPARFNATDITYVLSENLIIDGQPGGPLLTTARESARLTIDPGVVVKLAGARIEVQPGGTLIAEGDTNHIVTFTSLADNSVGSGGTFAANGDNAMPRPGDWGGFFFWPTSQGSLDHALINYGGGRVPDAGGFDNFNAVEIYQAQVRIANSTLENNAGGLAASNRNGRGGNAVAATLPTMGETIFVIGAQPALINNVINDNQGAAISIDANSFTTNVVPDWGRGTGPIDRFTQFDNNQGPLVRLNAIGNVSTNAAINGMVVRGGVLTTNSVWDNTDIVHVLLDSIQVPNSTTLRLESSATNSLVVKLQGSNAGFDATGTPLDITNRVGGSLQVLGTPQHPVVMTSFNDGTVGAGLTPDSRPNNNTSNAAQGTGTTSVSTGKPGDWNGITLDKYSNDTNLAVVNEAEPAYNGGIGTNETPATAQSLGQLAPNPSSGNETQRLGFDVHGTIPADNPGDVATYTFKGTAGTQAWFSVGNTPLALDTVLELVDANGNVLARSDNAVAEATDPTRPNALSAGRLLTDPNYPGGVQLANNLALPLQSDMFQSNVYPSQNVRNFGSINPLDPGMRLVLPGTTGTLNDYYVRIYSKGPTPATFYVPGDGVSSGNYHLQIRLQELAQAPGSVVQYADVRYATNGISVLGLPANSPLVADSSQVPSGGNVTDAVAANNNPNGNPSNVTTTTIPQNLGNLLATNSSSLSVSGAIDNSKPTQVDWYKFNLNYNLVQSIQGVNAANKIFSTIFQVGYADGLTRPDTTISVFDSTGTLILSGRNSNVADQQPRPTMGNDTTNLSHISFGNNDPFIGSVELPAGTPAGAQFTYYVAISSNATLPTAMDAYFNPNSAQPSVRLEPIEGVQRVVEDHILSPSSGDPQGYTSGNAQGFGFPTQQVLPTAPNPILPTSASQAAQLVTPFNLSSMVLYVNTTSSLYGVNPASGNPQTYYGNFGGSANTTGDIVMRSDGKLYAYQALPGDSADAGQLVQVDPGNAANVLVYPADTIPKKIVPNATVGALTFQRNADGFGKTAYDLFYSVPPNAGGGHDSTLWQANAPDSADNIASSWGKSYITPNDSASLGSALTSPHVAFLSTTNGLTHLPNVTAGDTFVLNDAVHAKQTFEYGSSVPELTISPSATGQSIQGETITVTVGGFLVGGNFTPPITRTFQFVIGNAAPATGDIAISVNSTDTFATLASDAAATINNNMPFPGTATAFGNRIDFINGPASDPGVIAAVGIFPVPGAGGLMSLANPTPELDIAPGTTGGAISGTEFLVRSGINSAVHVFQFVLNGNPPSNPNDTPVFVNPGDNAATLAAEAVNTINTTFGGAVATQGVSPYTNRILFVDDSTGISVNPPATASGPGGPLSVLNCPFIGGANIVPYTAGDSATQLEFQTINEINAVFGALGSRLWAYDDVSVPIPTGAAGGPDTRPSILTGTMDIQFSVNADFSNTQLPEIGQGPGGYIDGMAFDGNLMYGVSNEGGVYQIGGTQDMSRAGINKDGFAPSGIFGGFFDSISGQFVVPMQYLPASSEYVARQYAFEGLALGPQDISLNGNGVPGQLANDLFAISQPSGLDPNAGAVLTAFTDGQSARGPAGAPDHVFDTPINFQSQTVPTGAYQDFTTIPSIFNPTGLAFSPLDINLWHYVQPIDDGNDGPNDEGGSTDEGDHLLNVEKNAVNSPGVNTTFDNSRQGHLTQPAQQLSGEWRFGLDSQNAGQMAFGSDLLSNPAIANINNNPGNPTPAPFSGNPAAPDFAANGSNFGTYNLPGGAAGTLTALPFSLKGYSAADKPTLYFNYELNTRNSYSEPFKTSARVMISADGGKTWSELATNDGGNNNDPTLNAGNNGGVNGRTAYNPANGPNGQLSELPNYWTASANVATQTDPNTGLPIVDPRQQTQEMFDSTGTGTNNNTNNVNDLLVWRQARVDLGNFAGLSNLILRFDFSSNGQISIPSALRHELAQGDPNPGVHIPGDQFGLTSQGTDLPAPQYTVRGDQSQNNEHFGWAISDIIVGMAGRGELVTGVTPQTAFSDKRLGFIPGEPAPVFGIPAQQLTGPYQLEIRPGQVIGQTQNENAGSIVITQQYNIHDRMTSAFTLIAPDPQYQQTVPVPLNLPGAGALVGTMTFDFTNTPAPSGAGTLTFNAVGDLAGRDQYLALDFPDLTGNPAWVQLRQQLQQDIYFNERDKTLQNQTFSSTVITLTQAQIQTLIAADNANPLNPPNVIHITVFPPPGTLVNGITSLSATLDYSAVAGAGLFPGDPNSILDGQTFQISDGLKTVTFEYDNNNQLNNPGDIRIGFNSSDTSAQLAQEIVAAINQSGLNVVAATADAPSHATSAGPGDTSNLINLFGAAWVSISPTVALKPTEPNDTLATAVPVPLGFSQPVVTASDTIGVGPDRQPGQPAQPFGTPAQDVHLYSVQLNVGQQLAVQVDTPAPIIVAEGSISAGTSSTTFSAAAGTLAARDGAYVNDFLFFTSGALAGERRQVTGYTASTFTFTFASPFSALPAVGDLFSIETNNAGLDSYLRVFDPLGNELQNNDNGPTPGKPFTSTDSYLQFTAPSTGTFYFGVSGAGNTSYNPVNDGGTQPGSTGIYTINFNLLNATRVIQYDNAQGDAAVARPQGVVIVQDNRITNSLADGVLATAAPREGLPGDGNTNLPHPGGVRNLPTLDVQRLVPGVVIENNIISGSGQAGIQFSGDPQAAGQPLSAVPFGRIVNNTIVGGLTSQSGVGINVTNNASPTILNNILANLTTGIQVDASSQALQGPPVLGENIYQNDGPNPSNPNNVGPILEQGGIDLAPTDPLFVNAAAGNFYLAKGSLAVDSALASLQDRSAMIAVTAPLGIAPSPILAPIYDINGQLRIHDPSSQSGSGTGSQIFQDRGAIDRVDITGPIATLLNPVDNGIEDQNPAVNIVNTLGLNLSEFDIQLNDGIGSGVDNNTVNVNEVALRRNGVLLTPGFDYSFVYDNNNHIIRLIAASGVWQNGNVYEIAINNGVKFDPLNPQLQPSTFGGIKDLAGNFLQANSASGPFSGFTYFQLILGGLTNEPPAVVLPLSTPRVFEGDMLVFTPNPTPPVTPGVEYTTPISIFDVDANGGVEQVTLTASNGILQLDPTQMAAVDAAAGAQVLGNGTSTLTIKAVLGDTTVSPAIPGINTVLGILQYIPDPASAPYFAGPATITVVANDLGNSPPPAQVTTVTLPVNVIAVNIPPTTTGPTAASVVEDTPVQFSTATNNPITVGDPDITGANQASTAFSLKETVSAVEGTVTLPTVAGLFTTAGGPLTVGTGSSLTFTGSVDAINTALNGLTFTPTPEYYSGVSWAGNRIVFGGGATATVVGGQMSVVGKGTEIDLLSTTTGSQINGETITVTAPVGAGATVSTTFELDSDNHTTTNARINVLPGDGAYTLAIEIAQAIDNAYNYPSFPRVGVGPLASTPGLISGNPGNPTSANDAITLSLGATATVNSANQNLTVANGGAEVDVAATATGSTINGQTITVTLPLSPFSKAPVPGQTYTAIFEFNADGHATNNISITVGAGDNAALLATEAAKAINAAFLTPPPVLGLVATDASAAAVTIQTNDQGNVGLGPDHVTNPFPLSAPIQSIVVTVNAVTDNPLLSSGNETLQTVDETATPSTNPGTQISQMLASGANGKPITLRAAFPGNNATDGIAVTGFSDVTDGTWQYSLDGTNWTTFAASIAAAAQSAPSPSANALLLDATDFVRFLPKPYFQTDSLNAPVDMFFYAWDETTAVDLTTGAQLSLVPGGTANMTTTGANPVGDGGSSPFSSTGAAAVLDVAAQNVSPPVVTTPTPPVGGFTTPENTPFSFTAAGGNVISVSDEDSTQGPQPSQVKLTISTDPATGVLNLGSTSGLSVSGNSPPSATIILQGSYAAVNAALNGLTFTPVHAFAGAATITLVANDLGNFGAGGPLDSTPQTINLEVVAVHQAPVLGASPPFTQPSFPSIVENVPPSSNPNTSQIGSGAYTIDTMLRTGGAVTSDQTGTGFLQLDTDAGALEGIAVTGLSGVFNGVWEYSLNGGSSWISFGNVSTTAARLLSLGDLVRFRPNQNFSGTVDMNFYAWDQTSGTDGALANVSTRGGQTAFSTAGQTATLSVNLVNQPPSFGLTSNTTTDENNTIAVSGGVPGTGSNANLISVPNFAYGITSGPAGQPAENVTFFVSTNRPDLFATDPNTGLPVLSIDGSASATPGTLRFMLAKDVFGVATLTVYAKNSAGADADADGDSGGADSDNDRGQDGNDTSLTQFATLTVNGINDPPTMNPIPNQTVLEGATPPTISLTGIQDGLNQSQNLTITAAATPQSGDNPALVTNLQVGYVSPDTAGTLNYSLAPGQVGAEQITVTVKNDGSETQGGVNTFTETFVVTVNSSAPTARAQVVTTLENQPTSPIVLAGIDPAGKALSAVISSLPTGGTLYQVTSGGAQGAAITAVPTPVANLNEVIYVPAVDANGAPYDSFGFFMTETSGTQSSPPAQVTIYVTPVNQAPTFVEGPNQTVFVGAGPQTVAGWASQISPGAANESNQTLTFIVTQTAGPAGLFSVGPSIDASGNLTYAPSGLTGTDSFSVVLHDNGGTANGGHDTSVAQFFTITATATPPVPTGVPDTFVLSQSASSSATSINGVLANDVSNDNQHSSLRAVLISSTTHGTLTFNTDGSFTYTPGPGFVGLDRFTYEATEGAAASPPTTVTLLSYQASIVDKLYNQVLGRAADDSGLQYWTSLIMNGASYSVVAEGIFDSNERLNAIIAGGTLGVGANSITYPGYYPQFLLRPADPAGLAYWEGIWKRDGGPDNVIAGMIGSPEFYASAGQARPDLSPNAAWVTALYERLLNRAPDAQGLQYWTSNLDAGTMTRQQVVLGFVRSPENFANLTTAFFQEYLLRQPSAAELNQYVGQFEAGATQSDIQVAIINLPEYANTPPAPAAGTVGPSLYPF